MLTSRFTYNPIEQMEEFKPELFQKYIDICNRQKKDELTSSEIIAEIRNSFYNAHPDVAWSSLNEIWKTVKPRIEANAGLAQFILDFKATESNYFFPWLISVWTSPSKALEMAYGAGNNLHGWWDDKIPESDRIYYFVQNVPTLVYNRERQLKVADLVMAVQNKYPYGEKSKVIDLGAGRMSWARYHGFRFGGPSVQEIYAFDMDPSIVPEDLFPGRPLSLLGLNYKQVDFRKDILNPEYLNTDLVVLGGVASYYPLEAFVNGIVIPIYKMLKTGGGFFFDLQLDCPQYVWSVKLFDWPEMNLMKSPAEAISTVEQFRRKLWKAGMRMGADYALDTYNESASSVMVTLTKL